MTRWSSQSAKRPLEVTQFEEIAPLPGGRIYWQFRQWCAIFNSNYEMGRQNADAECLNSHSALCLPSVSPPLWHHDTTDTRPHGQRGTSRLRALPNRAQRGPARNHALRSASVRCFNPGLILVRGDVRFSSRPTTRLTAPRPANNSHFPTLLPAAEESIAAIGLKP
jgi:hypothetical protein